MITVEFNPKSGDVGITLDEDGANLFLELVHHFQKAGVEDHIHIRSGPQEINGQKRLPEDFALSLEKRNLRPEVVVSEMLTLVFQPNQGQQT